MKKRYWIPGLVLSVLVVTWFTGPRVPEPVYGTALPELPASLEELARTVEEAESGKPIRRDNQARIRFYNDSVARTEYAVVYLHGFGGSFGDGYPANVALADSLRANLFVARWGEHGLIAPNSMVGFTAESAWKDAREALAIGQALGDKVIILSTSTGGTLALKLAAEFPDAVHALVNFSPNVKDDMPGTWILKTPWGPELAGLIGIGDGMRNPKHEEAGAARYFDTAYVASALTHLQNLVATTMTEETFRRVTCPVLTLYYYENFLQEDERVEVDVYDEMHSAFATPDHLHSYQALDTPKNHFLGSEIKSKDWKTPLAAALTFIRGLEG